MKFLRNCWYVAAWQSELKDQPIAEKIIGDYVVIYRGSEGQAIALSDTCPHRFAPLHRGSVVGDQIQCPYHGLRFGADGRCTHSPFAADGRPAAASIRSYPVVERDRFIWIWMGDPEKADEALIPDFHELNDAETYTMTSEGKLEQNLAFELVVDNLMDLSHGQFLHPTTLGNEAMASGTTTSSQGERHVKSDRLNPDGDAPTLFTISGAVPEGTRVDFWNDMRWTAPSIYSLEVGVTPTGRPRSEGAFFGSAHMLTPRDETHTVYRYTLFRTFAKGNQAISDAIDGVVLKAFVEEDEPMIREVQNRMDGRDFWKLRPLILPTDKAGVLVRRLYQKLLREEEAAGSSETPAEQPVAVAAA